MLNYHHINNVDHSALTLSTSEFRAQMQYLKNNGYTSITPDQLIAYLDHGVKLPNKPVLITFDDGYEDNYKEAYPILKECNLTATIFLISHYIGWKDYLTWDEIMEMKQNGVLFEGHTFSHPYLSKIHDAVELHRQLVESKNDLEQHLGYSVDYLAYPYGDYNADTIRAVKNYGYKAAFSIELGDDSEHDNMYALNRIPVFQSYTHTYLRFWLNLHFPKMMNELNYIKKSVEKRTQP